MASRFRSIPARINKSVAPGPDTEALGLRCSRDSGHLRSWGLLLPLHDKVVLERPDWWRGSSCTCKKIKLNKCSWEWTRRLIKLELVKYSLINFNLLIKPSRWYSSSLKEVFVWHQTFLKFQLSRSKFNFRNWIPLFKLLTFLLTPAIEQYWGKASESLHECSILQKVLNRTYLPTWLKPVH